MFEIIRESSPYFTTFKYAEFDKVKQQCLESLQKIDSTKNFIWHLDEELASLLAPTISLLELLGLSRKRMVLFVSRPGYRDNPHKDGDNHLFGINFMIQVPDDKCITSWYADETLANAPTCVVHQNGKELRKIEKPPEGKYPTLFQTVFEQGECVLFNTSIYHDWNNKSTSSTDRVVLTLRPFENSMTYAEAHAILFGN
jgi:ectoine hydroxylase-related dioxygenase (phytanoyl-CoA dioxygenase family)